MRVRRLSALFWTSSIIVFVFILYVLTDMTFQLPNSKPGLQELDNSKWTAFESKLRSLENEVNEHDFAIDEMKLAVDDIQQSQELEPPKKSSLNRKEKRGREFRPPKEKTASKVVVQYKTTCPIQKHVTPKTDVQMLSMYERIMFDDKDGGAWKQGWNIEYREDQWSQKNKLKVFIVPHSHNDPGWLKTFEDYYKTQTRAIFDNMIEKLKEGIGRKFIWAEVSYLALWWDSDATEEAKNKLKSYLKSGQLEIVTGGWVMNDEANSHWLSVAQQLTTGHQWLMDNLEYIPKNTWAIDPFGHSSTQPYLLKLAGFENSVIQRVHYRVKKELAMHKQLEFKWRQLWDGVGKTDMFTHMMPFYSYDVPHTCGPDPKICCQFDFRRLPGNGLTCPWGAPPRKVIHKNVDERSSVILDQWRKKAQLYRTNVLLVPLGDDFRYDRANEWDQQYMNYEAIIDFINNNEAWNAEVQFGTLQDYFKAVHSELKLSEFPVLSGDFFTYADRAQHYWSGYYTSRPFYKNMDRILLAYVRAAEIISTQALVQQAVSKLVSIQLRERVELARRALALFQHHDGITGTARDDVKSDYGVKMLKAIKSCQSAIQQSAYHLLKQPTLLEQTQEDIYFDVDDIWRRSDELPTRITIALDEVSRSRKIVLYNALAFRRQEILTVYVSSPHVEVFDRNGYPIMSQISPLVVGDKRLAIAANKYELCFPVTVQGMSLAQFTVSLRDDAAINKYTSYARVRVYNADYWSLELPKMFVVERHSRAGGDVAVRAGNSSRLVVTPGGLLRALGGAGGDTTPLHMDFVQYGSQKAPDNNSGAYLFLPDGPAASVRQDDFPEMVVLEGPHRATLHAAVVAPGTADIVITMSVYNNPSLDQTEVEISSTVLIDPQVNDLELAMRFSTPIENGDVFYTDLNGMQMIKRRNFEKLPLQANFYPLPAAAYIQDDVTRLTLLTSTPLGFAALQPGQIEVMQDRRLSKDDNRGMNQGVLDNVRTRHVFKLVLENAYNSCTNPVPFEHPSGQLSLGAHVTSQLLLQPLVVMHYSSLESAATTRAPVSSAADVVLASANPHVKAKNKTGGVVGGIGLTFHRVDLEMCYGNPEISKWYPIGDGQVQLPDTIGVPSDSFYDSSLTFVHVGNPIPNGVLSLCPMEVRSVFINHTTV